MSLKYFFAGGEVSSHRKLFDINHVEHVSMSYVGLTRRIKFSRPWPVADHFPEYQKVFLDSGTHTLNKPGSVIDEDSAREMAAAYMAFALENLPRLTMVSEFDAQILGREWILAMRGDFWDAIPRDKFLPVWHSGDGIGELEALAERYSRVGVLQGDLSDPNLPAVLNGLVRSSGVLLHGVGMTRMEPMADIAWDSVGSMSWNSPVMHGDFIVWDGRKLHRYPKSRKEASRLRHRAYLHEMGFNTDAIEADTGPESVAEIQRLSIWSWEHFVQDINNRKLLHPFGVTNPIDVLFPESTEPVNEPVDNPPVTGVNGPLVPTTTENRETTLIPVMGVNVFKLAGRDDAGTAIEVEEPRLEIRSKSMRVCNDCFLREKCPGFKPASTCFASETEVITKEGVRPIAELSGGKHELLTADGRWVWAPVHAFGKQALMKITLGRNKSLKTLYATPEHEWLLRPYTHTGRRRTVAKTHELLPGDKLAFNFPSKPEDLRMDSASVARGFIFGDGSVSGNSSRASFFGEKDDAVVPFFAGFTNNQLMPGVQAGTEAYPGMVRNVSSRVLHGLPKFWKTEMPSVNDSPSDIYGWLAGYFAADGCVSTNNQIVLSCAKREVLEHVRTLATSIGLGTYQILTQMRKGFPWMEPSAIYGVTFMRGDLSSDFFIIPEHRKRFEAKRNVVERRGWVVRSVEVTDRFETVYCATVDGTHSFTLADFIHTKNCLYDIPIEIRTRPQLIAVRDALITMQTQRVLFLQMSEQIQGGYPDQNLSAEMDRLRRMIKDRFDIERESITITGPQVHASGNPGYLSSLLGSDVADKMTALPGGPVNADDFIKDNEIYEGLVVE